MASVFAFWRWPRRRWFRIMWCLFAIGLLVALPLIIIEFKKSNFSVKYQAWFISGMFVLMAIPVTVYEVAMHLEYFSRPKLQIRVIRILWMVPVYAIDSWFALRFKVITYASYQLHASFNQTNILLLPVSRLVCKCMHSLCHCRTHTCTWMPQETATKPLSSTTSSCTC